MLRRIQFKCVPKSGLHHTMTLVAIILLYLHCIFITIHTLPYNIVVVLVWSGLVWSSHSICVGYETNNEDKRKIILTYICQRSHIKYQTPASWINRPSGKFPFTSSIQWDRSCSHQNQVLVGVPALLTTSLHNCKLVSSQHRLELFVFSLQYTLQLDLVCRFSWLHQQNNISRYRSIVFLVSYQQATDMCDDKIRICCSTY